MADRVRPAKRPAPAGIAAPGLASRGSQPGGQPGPSRGFAPGPQLRDDLPVTNRCEKVQVVMTDQPEDRSGNGADAITEVPQEAPRAGAAALPLFYKAPQPLHNERHAGKGLKAPGDYSFAGKTHAVVLQVQEFRLAAAFYPIIFADEEPPIPLAVLGYRDGENLFVDAAGAWAEGTYVPAYVRRYPFATGQGAQDGEHLLYLDEASDLVVDLDLESGAEPGAESGAGPGVEPLFADGQPSERTQKALEFCTAFQRQAAVTNAFVEAVMARDLLESKEVRLDLPGGGSQLLTGLRVIAEQKFNALPDADFLEWREKGWLPLVYWHWASMDNFFRMVLRG